MKRSKNLRIKVSGCFNSCGQHHVADIGFYGNSRNVSGYTVPHFQVMLGGQVDEQCRQYGLAMGAVPSKRDPGGRADRSTVLCAQASEGTETLSGIRAAASARKRSRTMVEDLTEVPAARRGSDFYSDWGDPREFTSATWASASAPARW